jgi:serine/threonine protein kinase
MPHELVVIAGPDQGKAFTLAEGTPATLGRGEQAQVRLNDPRVSRAHCVVELRPAGPYLTDSGSSFGTFLNGQRVAQSLLRVGDVIRIGDTELSVRGPASADQPTLAPTGPAAAQAAPAVSTPPPDFAATLRNLSSTQLGDYRLGELIAEGKAGAVFKAQDVRSGQAVAVKVLATDVTQHPEAEQRVARAATIMLPLRHPHLVALLDWGTSGPHCWVAMDYIDGESLTQVIDRIGIAGMLDWKYAFRVAMHIARALILIHHHQIIHRNLTPRNVLIRKSDKAALLGDLVLAKAVEDSSPALTRPGEIVGDVHYMSPERLHGNDPVDARSDIYSLGALLYALLTGRPPLTGITLLDTITRICQVEPERPRKVQLAISDLFEQVVMKMLAKHPASRYQSALELLQELNRIASLQGIAVT